MKQLIGWFLNYGPILISCVALYVSYKVWRMNKNNFENNIQPNLQIYSVSTQNATISGYITISLKNSGNPVFNYSKVKWISSKSTEAEFQNKNWIMEGERRVDVSIIKLAIEDFNIFQQGKFILKYKDKMGNTQKVTSPTFHIENYEVKNKKEILGKYFM